MKPSLSNLAWVMSCSILLFGMPAPAQVRQAAGGPLIIFHAGSLSIPFERIIE
jgi:ABC-type molybdate transport system substrate-binding protein